MGKRNKENFDKAQKSTKVQESLFKIKTPLSDQTNTVHTQRLKLIEKESIKKKNCFLVVSLTNCMVQENIQILNKQKKQDHKTYVKKICDNFSQMDVNKVKNVSKKKLQGRFCSQDLIVTPTITTKSVSKLAKNIPNTSTREQNESEDLKLTNNIAGLQSSVKYLGEPILLRQLRIDCLQTDVNKLKRKHERNTEQAGSCENVKVKELTVNIPKIAKLSCLSRGTKAQESLTQVAKQNTRQDSILKNVNFEKQLVVNLVNLDLMCKESQVSINKTKVPNSNLTTDMIPSKNANTIKMPTNTKYKTVTFENTKNLRRKTVKNYAEQSLDLDNFVVNKPAIKPKENCNKLPIYKNAAQEKPQKKLETSNLYDFDECDIDDIKKTKRAKTKRKVSMFDKTTHDILQKIEQKEAKQKTKQIRGKKRKVNLEVAPSYQKAIDNIMQSVINKIQEKEISTSNKNVSKTPAHEPIRCQVESELQFQNSEIQICQNSDEEFDENDMNFGFDDDLDENSPENQQINILSNIVIQRRKIDSPSLFHHQRPNANSTICKQSNKSNPWRFCSNELKRNPHFLEVKRSALPSLTQDPIIDHTLDLDISTRSTVHQPSTPKKSLIQTSILDYVDTDNFKENQENVRTQSLFDCEEFDSPVKRNHRTVAKTTVKRKVLAPRDDNITETTSNADNVLATNPVKSPENNRMTYFGFDDSDEEETDKKKFNPKPFRINMNLKKYTRKHGNVGDKKLEESPVVHEATSSNMISIDERNNEEDENTNLRLFDDPETIFNEKMSSPKIAQKRRRRRRLSWKSDDGSVDEKPRKKRKDIMTKSEEERFEQWAAAFNSMCEEVEKHELEIE